MNLIADIVQGFVVGKLLLMLRFSNHLGVHSLNPPAASGVPLFELTWRRSPILNVSYSNGFCVFLKVKRLERKILTHQPLFVIHPTISFSPLRQFLISKRFFPLEAPRDRGGFLTLSFLSGL
jgi:hypothetical protein